MTMRDSDSVKIEGRPVEVIRGLSGEIKVRKLNIYQRYLVDLTKNFLCMTKI